MILIIPYEATRFLIYPSSVLVYPFISFTLLLNEFRLIPFDSFSILFVPLRLFPYGSICKKKVFLMVPCKDLSGNFCTNLGSGRIFAVRLRGNSCSFLILGNPVNYLRFLVKPSKLSAGTRFRACIDIYNHRALHNLACPSIWQYLGLV